MLTTRWERLALVMSLGVLFASTVAPTSLAAPPAGLNIGTAATCIIRSGGHEGFRVEYEYNWYYDSAAGLGESVTVGGTYALFLHNPTTDTYENLFSSVYGLSLRPDTLEKRLDRLSPRAPHWVFDHVMLVVDWQIEETGESGSEVGIFGCEVEPPPAGKELITATTASGPAEQPPLNETFVSTADPSPHAALKVDTSLYCRSIGRRGVETNWSLVSTYDLGGDEEGMTVSGVVRLFTRTVTGAYTQVSETPFALLMLPTETRDISGFVEGPGVVASKLEVEWRASLGTQVDPGAPVQRVLRTTACSA